MNITNRIRAIAIGIFVSLGISAPGYADDTEIFVGNASVVGPGVQPNVLFILDTSGSMDGQLQTQEAYDPAQIYATGSCDPNRIYWRQGNVGSVPNCTTSNNFFVRGNLRCNQATLSLDATGSFIGASSQFSQASGLWGPLVAGGGTAGDVIECAVDSGVHGDGVNMTDLWATDTSGPYTSDLALEIAWPNQNIYTFYDGNWLNWNASPPIVTRTRLQVVQEVTKNLLDSITGVNVGLMRFSNNDSAGNNNAAAEGGMVIHAMEDVVTARAAMKAKIDALDHDGYTPLSETMYEAGLYYRGAAVDYGLTSAGNTGQPEPSVPESRLLANQALYDSPIEYTCQENYIVLLTDGAPTQDTSANANIQGQPNFNTLVGATCDGAGNGACLDDASEYLYEADISPLPGPQFVSTYTIGFTVDLPILKETAENAGGQYYLANDTATLTSVLTQTLLNILNENTTFSSPAVAVNAFNRTQNLNDLYITVFGAAGTEHWPGNLKKYRLVNGEITDAQMLPAVNPASGFFNTTAQSFWSAAPDGADVALGGAANRLPVPGSRELYTYTGPYPVPVANEQLNGGANALVDTNAAMTDAMLNIGLPGDPTRADLTNWARGVDVLDEDQDVNTMTRNVMGDPLHASPALVIYGGTAASPDVDDALVFVATNDGYLHAIDPVTGIEQWAFVPQEKLGDLKDLYFNAQVANKHYGIDGNLTPLIIDVNGNGIVEPIDGDKVYLYFGLRRGGSYVYGLDVTNQNDPLLMFVNSTADLPHLGQTWSTPVPATVDIAGVPQNPDNRVLIFGGGYDLTQDNTLYSQDIVGNTIYMIDAVDGSLLWWAGNDAAADLTLADMNNAIASDIRVLDMNGDGMADRMYASDMGGRIFRFDIFNNTGPAGLVTGGVFASLGAADLAAPAALTDTRRFYYAPDTAIITNAGLPYLNVGIGSGYRAHPLEPRVIDRFYALRDYDIFRQLTQPEYNALVPILDSDATLVDVTADPNATLPVNARGWQLTLTNPGEKVLAESRTFDNKLFFTTYQPLAPASPCDPEGRNRLYAVNAFNASPFIDLDQDGTPGELEDRSTVLANQTGIAPEVTILFPEADDPNCVGAACNPPPECLVGLENCESGFINAPVRTFWTQQGAE